MFLRHVSSSSARALSFGSGGICWNWAQPDSWDFLDALIGWFVFETWIHVHLTKQVRGPFWGQGFTMFYVYACIRKNDKNQITIFTADLLKVFDFYRFFCLCYL